MSKILCTLAFYHDGGTLKPQLVFSCNPVTNLVMKGTDWKSARISNTNASAGARDRFEYSFTGGKSVTRCSLVMNTSAILPPLIWLSKHPCGPPTKTGPRGPPGLKATEDAKRKQKEELHRLEAKKNPKRIEDRRSSRNSIRDEERQQMLEEHGVYEPRNDREAREASRRMRLDDRIDRPHDYAQIADRDARHEERQKPFRGSSSAPSDHYAMSGIPDRETRRQERLKRLRSSSSASESSDSGGGDRYRRSSGHSSGRNRKRYHGGDYAGYGSHGRHDIEEEGLGYDGDGGGGGDGGV